MDVYNAWTQPVEPCETRGNRRALEDIWQDGEQTQLEIFRSETVTLEQLKTKPPTTSFSGAPCGD